MLLHLLKLVVIAIAIATVRSDTNYRLNTTITPESYAISLMRINFDTGDETAFTFDAEINIVFISEANIKQIKLHSEGLKFSASNISITTDTATLNLEPSNPLEFDEKYSFAYINLESEIEAGVDYNLRILYHGPIRDDLKGFYRNYYLDKGIKKWLGTTQFESTHARNAFPCFDEPGIKAIFYLAIDRPSYYQPTLTNTKMQITYPLANGFVREVFYPSPKMSTYLVAFLISEYEAAAISTEGSNEFGFYTRPEAKNYTEYAFDYGKRVVNALGDFFGIDYYSVDSNLKLDHVALLDFNSGAMENWGLIKYREALLLYVPGESSPYYKYRSARILAHETTHMWFGNLVTCHWWSNTWLNEGFANYFQDHITALIEPDVGSADYLVTDALYMAYDADNSPEANPISYDNVNSPAEINDHFGTISYQKASSVIRMMHHLMGDKAFKFGLNYYLEANKFQPGYPDQLYDAFQRGVLSENSMSMYPETNIVDVMTSWITQAGHPIVYVNVNREESTVSLTQKRFYIDPSNESNELYKIPITYTIGNDPDFNDTKPAFVMHEKTHVFDIPKYTDPLSWVIVNVQETGLYRVNYDAENWKLIANALKGNNREKIHHLNRAKIVNDLFAFVYSDEISFDLLHEVLGFLTEETNYSVWLTTIKGFNELRSYYLGTDTLNDIDNFALELLENVINKLGYEEKDSDDNITGVMRMHIMRFACKLGHQGCLDNMMKLYTDFKENGKEIYPGVRLAAYCTGLRLGNGDDYDFIWNRMSTTNLANEVRLITEVLGCSSDESSLRRYLVSMLEENSPIRRQDLTVPLTGVLSNYTNVPVVIDELDKNVAQWITIYNSLDSVLSTIASSLHTENEFNSYESWLSACSQCGKEAVTVAKASLAKARAATIWADNHKEAISTRLRNDATNKQLVH